MGARYEPVALIPFDEVKAAALRDAPFNAILAEWGMDEVLVAMTNLSASVQRQLHAKKDRDADWRDRAGHLQSCADGRIRALKQSISERNRRESATVEAAHRKYGAFAEELAMKLYLLDPAALRDIHGPGGHGSAEEWLHARRARAAERAQKEEVVAGG